MACTCSSYHIYFRYFNGSSKTRRTSPCNVHVLKFWTMLNWTAFRIFLKWISTEIKSSDFDTHILLDTRVFRLNQFVNHSTKFMNRIKLDSAPANFVVFFNIRLKPFRVRSHQDDDISKVFSLLSMVSKCHWEMSY